MAKRKPPLTSEESESLESTIVQLSQEVRVLRQAIDEFRVDFTHLLRNLPDNLPPPYQHLRSLSETFAVDLPDDGEDAPDFESVEQKAGEDSADSPLSGPEGKMTHDLEPPRDPPIDTSSSFTAASQPQSQLSRRTKRRKSVPLSMRIIQDPPFTDLVRFIKYGSVSLDTFNAFTSTLVERYGQERVYEACTQLTEHVPGKGKQLQLTAAAKEAAANVLGPSPASIKAASG